MSISPNNLSMIQGLFVDGKSNWSALYHEGYPSYHPEFANQWAEPPKEALLKAPGGADRLQDQRLQPRDGVCEMNIEPQSHPLERSGSGMPLGAAASAAGVK